MITFVWGPVTRGADSPRYTWVNIAFNLSCTSEKYKELSVEVINQTIFII